MSGNTNSEAPSRRRMLQSLGGVSAAGVATGAFSQEASASTAVPAAEHPDFERPTFEIRHAASVTEKYRDPRDAQSAVDETAGPLLEALADRDHIEAASASSLRLEAPMADAAADLRDGYEPRVVAAGSVGRERIATDVAGESGRTVIDVEPERNRAFAFIPESDGYTAVEQAPNGQLSMASTTPNCTSERCSNDCNCVGLPFINTCTGTVEYMVHYGNGVKRCGDIVSEIDCSQPCEGCCSGDCGPYSC